MTSEQRTTEKLARGVALKCLALGVYVSKNAFVYWVFPSLKTVVLEL